MTERDEARFWAKVALPNEQGCMLWTGEPDLRGYGHFTVGYSQWYAHRVSYVLANGPIPEGLQIDHVKARGCKNKHCVAPLHLEAVTQRENLLRGSTITAANAAKTHCLKGHAFDVANTYRTPRGSRQCRACKREHQRTYVQREAAKQ